jgi:hypothetical protein
VNYAWLGGDCHTSPSIGSVGMNLNNPVLSKSWSHGSHLHAIKKGDGWFSL